MGPYFLSELPQIDLLPFVSTILMPKIHSVDDLNTVSQHIEHTLRSAGSARSTSDPINIVASIESARALFNVGQIASWTPPSGPTSGKLGALLVRPTFLPRRQAYSDRGDS